MIYILALFLILAIIFSSFSGGGNLISNFLSQAKDKINATIFPKTEREIIIDNINSDYQNIDKFFLETAPILLNSKTIPEKDKAIIKKAVEAFNDSKGLISNLSQIEKNNKGIMKSLIDKVVNLINTPQPDPTNIPPQCHLECSQ